jgi:hypothetical protein
MRATKSMTVVLLLRGEGEMPGVQLIREVLSQPEAPQRLGAHLPEEVRSPPEVVPLEKVVFLRHMFLERHQKGVRCV